MPVAEIMSQIKLRGNYISFSLSPFTYTLHNDNFLQSQPDRIQT